jgi:3-hydroxyisobutyrate dehydrogenase-like beta-hydroxyacid dehydrogenase
MKEVRKVSLVGLGAMGSALAGAFLRKGADVKVWNTCQAYANWR